jgi:hypothetical protein
MAYLVSVIQALTSAIGAAWPECKANGVYHVLQAARLTLDLKVENGALPFAVIDWDLGPAAEWGLVNRVDDGEVVLYRVADDSEGLDTLVRKLEALREVLWNTDISPGQIVEWPAVSFSLDLPLNDYFLRTQRPFSCGAVVCRLVVGETP